MLNSTKLMIAPACIAAAMMVGCTTTTETKKVAIDHSGYAYTYPTGYRDYVVYYSDRHSSADTHYQRYNLYRGNYGHHSALPHYHTTEYKTIYYGDGYKKKVVYKRVGM